MSLPLAASVETFWIETLPALAGMALALTALGAYAVRTCYRGRFRDAEQEARGGSPVLTPWLRSFFAWTMTPLVGCAKRSGITPTGITLLSVVFSVLAGATAAAGWLGLAGLAYLVSGVCDFLDGRLARLTHRTTASGAALDSILDRYSDAAVLVGLGWFYRGSWVLVVVMLFLAGGFFVPYVRARGEGLGIALKVGLMQRPERVVLLGVALILAPAVDRWLAPEYRGLLLAGVLVLLAVLTHVTAVVRIVHLKRALDRREGGPR